MEDSFKGDAHCELTATFILLSVSIGAAAVSWCHIFCLSSAAFIIILPLVLTVVGWCCWPINTDFHTHLSTTGWNRSQLKLPTAPGMPVINKIDKIQFSFLWMTCVTATIISSSLSNYNPSIAAPNEACNLRNIGPVLILYHSCVLLYHNEIPPFETVRAHTFQSCLMTAVSCH